MRRRIFHFLPLMLLVAAWLLTACATPAAGTPAQVQKPAQTQAPAATKAPAATQAPAQTQVAPAAPVEKQTQNPPTQPAVTEAPAGAAAEATEQPTTMPSYPTQPAAPGAAVTQPVPQITQPAPQPTQAAASAQITPIASSQLPPSATPAAPPATLVPEGQVPTPEAHLVQVEWPAEMRLGDSDVVRLMLVPSSQGYTLITEYPEHQVITQTVTVQRQPGFELFAAARLDGPGFDLAPSGEQEQYLAEGAEIGWRWSLTPRRSGSQRLALALALRWKPQSGAFTSPREVTIYSKSLDIQVHSFLGMTQTQALVAAIFSLLFGGGLGALAIVYGPRRVARLRSVAPNARLAIELPAGMSLDPPVRALLQSLFGRYARLVVEHEFLSGYSGARTLLALPVRPDGRADAYTIAKIGERQAIQHEFENYETYVKDTLPPVTARIQHPPVTAASRFVAAIADGGIAAAGSSTPTTVTRLAALQYTFIGQPGKPPVSLRQELLRAPDPAWLSRLMDTFGPNWWLQRRPYTFRIALEYDRLLPTHLVVEPVTAGIDSSYGQKQVIDGRLPASSLALQAGDLVALRHFAAAELRPDGRSLSLQGQPPPGHPPLRVRWLSPRRPDGALGRVVATRDDLLRASVADCDLFGLPDPFAALPGLLEETLTGGRSTIHGDLNLENILVGPGGMLWLIDFAATRDGHTLLDFAHLSAELVAHILAPQVRSAADYAALLRDPSASPYATWYALLEAAGEMARRCLFNPADPGEYHRSLALACLGALKYTNLDGHARHLLYLTAAYQITLI